MPHRPRLLVTTAHFWPVASDVSGRIQAECAGLRRMGIDVTVLTYQQDRTWPDELHVGGIHVLRVPRPRGILAYNTLRGSVARRLSSLARPFDGLWCYGASDLVAATVDDWNGGQPVVWQWTADDLAALCEGRLPQSSRRMMVLHRRSDRTLVPGRTCARFLVSRGVAAETVLTVPSTVEAAVDRTIGARRETRLAVGQAYYDLFLRGRDRLLAVWLDRLVPSKIASWLDPVGRFVEERRGIRACVVCWGGDERRVDEFLRDRGWHRLVVVPGVFSDFSDLLQLADLLLIPQPGEGLGWVFPQAIASGVPTLIAQHEALQDVCDAALRQNDDLYGSDSRRVMRLHPTSASPLAALAYDGIVSEQLTARLTQWWEEPHCVQQAVDQLQRVFLARDSLHFLMDTLRRVIPQQCVQPGS
ncbi:MAG: hypothetical protein KatS3mg111_3501 [Pirellulaceae bacterium]|nr:MAG: hypothetical protein KatS3mg111_3501 [Pirellulaceae bacterium]